MARIKVPQQFLKGIKLLALLENEPFEEFLAALKGIPPTINRNDLANRLKPLISSIGGNETSEITYALFGLHLGLTKSDVSSLDDFLESALNDLFERDIGQPKLTELQRAGVKERLSKMLTVRPLAIGVKAQSVLFEHEKNLTGVRILTDLRPVYGDNVNDGPAAFIIIHKLKISYLQEGDLREEYFAMDTKDLQTLIDALDRAKQKSQTLKSLIANVKISCIEAE